MRRGSRGVEGHDHRFAVMTLQGDVYYIALGPADVSAFVVWGQIVLRPFAQSS